MPNEKPDAEAALRKLGQHVRAAWAKNHPVTESQLEPVRAAVRQKWEQQQQAKRLSKSAAPSAPKRKPKPPRA